MKSIFLFCLVSIAIISCKEDEPSFSEFRFDKNGVMVNSEGVATKTISGADTTFEIHNLSRNSNSTESISFSDIPFEEHKFTYGWKDISIILNTVDPVSHTAYAYTAVGGELIVESLSNGILEGSFIFDFICTNPSVKDTVHLTNGHFKVSYSTIWYE